MAIAEAPNSDHGSSPMTSIQATRDELLGKRCTRKDQDGRYRCLSRNIYREQGHWECLDCGEIMFDPKLGKLPRGESSVYWELLGAGIDAYHTSEDSSITGVGNRQKEDDAE